MSRTFATRFSPVAPPVIRLESVRYKNVFVHFKAFFIFKAGFSDFDFEWELKKVSGVLDGGKDYKRRGECS